MARSLIMMLIGSGALLSACDRLDTLAVIDSPDRRAVIIDNVGVPSGDRIICIRSAVSEPCSKRTAEIVVTGSEPADIQPGWADDSRVTVTVVRGELEKSASSALNGRVSIEYRQ